MINSCNVGRVRKQSTLYLSILAATTSSLSFQTIAEEKKLQLEEVLVTAQKRQQSELDVPISLDVVSGEMLVKNSIHSMRDLTLVTPSLNYDANNAPRSQSFGIRGVSTEGSSNSVQTSVGMVVDGVGLSRPVEFVMDMFDLERVEVLRGPQGTLFGKNATAGVVNIVTKRPTEEFEGFIETEFTDDDEILVRGAISGALSDSVRARVAASWRDQDELVDNISTSEFANDINGREATSIRAKLDVDFTENLNGLFTVDWNEVDVAVGNMPLVAQPGLELKASPLLPGDLNRINQDEENFVPNETWGFTSDLTWQLGETWSMKSITAYREAESDGTFDIDLGRCGVRDVGDPCLAQQGGLAYFNEGASRQPIEIERISQEFRFEYSTDGVNATFGLYYEDLAEDVNQSSPSFLRDANLDGVFDIIVDRITAAEVENRTFSAYADATAKATDNLELFAGVRYTHERIDINDYELIDLLPSAFGGVGPFLSTAGPLTEDLVYTRINGDTITIPNVVDTLTIVDTRVLPRRNEFDANGTFTDWSGRIGFNWSATEQINIYGSIAKGYKGPSADTSRRSTADRAVVTPEESTSFELGMKGRLFDNRVDLGLAVFYMQVDDLQQTSLIVGTTDTVLQNVGDMTTQGVELDLIALASENLTLSANVAYVDAEYEDVLFDCYLNQSAAEGCNVMVSGSTVQDLDGTQVVRSPELRYRLAADYNLPLSDMPFDGYARLSYAWTDDQQARFNQDPFTEIDSYERVDASLGIIDKEGKYEVSVFGKNLTDDWRPGTLIQATGLARSFFTPVRDQEAYYGIRARFNF